MYVKSMKDDYTLYDAFNFLGLHLYGGEWTGYEVWRERDEDPSPVLEALAPLMVEAEQLATGMSAKYREQKEVEGRKEIERVNYEIDNLRRRQSDVYNQIHKLDNLGSSQVKDYDKWVRFENAEGKLLKALCNDDLSVECLFGLFVKPEYWAEMPEGFSYDLEHSLIFLPSNGSAKQMSSGRIRKKKFEDWLSTIIPVSGEGVVKVSPFDQCRTYLRGHIERGKKMKTRDEYMEDARSCIDDLTARQFLQAWTEIVPDSWKARGRRKGN